MSKSSVLVFVLFVLFAGKASAQDYTIRGVSPDLYLIHKVAAKENWYSIGRIYNLSPKDIAVYNKLTIDKSLDIGKDLRVPLTAANFSQNESKSPGEVLVPVYHTVQEKEWLYRISQNYNKVGVDKLEKWNSLTKDGAKPGTSIIVGYLKVKDGNAVLATKPAAVTENRAVEPAPVKKEPVKEADSKKPEPAVVQNRQSSSKDGGYFRSLYTEGAKNTSGVAGIFKSTSGWDDGKYYALMNNVPVGTIVKINFSQSTKTVYAKVLGELPDMRESAGLALRLSDAAASELGATDSKFSVNVMY